MGGKRRLRDQVGPREAGVRCGPPPSERRRDTPASVKMAFVGDRRDYRAVGEIRPGGDGRPAGGSQEGTLCREGRRT